MACSPSPLGVDDPTLGHDVPADESPQPSAQKLGLPSPKALFCLVGEVRGLAGLDRRFAESADGLRCVEDIARAIGVNVLKAQHLAAELTRRGVLSETSVIEAFDIPDVDDF